jgi:hypothetical protein
MKFSVPMRLRVEADLPAAIAAAAERQRTKPAEWMRQRLREAVRAEGVELPPLADEDSGDDDGPPPFRPAPGQRLAA